MSFSVAKTRLETLQVYRLLQCVREGDKPYIEKLISMGVDDLINLTEPREGNGVLHLASVANNHDMLEFLIAKGASPNVQDRRGRTPLMLAAELGYDVIVSLLAKKNANMTLVDNEGKGNNTFFYLFVLTCVPGVQLVWHGLSEQRSCRVDVGSMSGNRQTEKCTMNGQSFWIKKTI